MESETVLSLRKNQSETKLSDWILMRGGLTALSTPPLRHGGPSINMEHAYETMSESRKRRGSRHLMWPSKKSFTCTHVSNSDGDSWCFPLYSKSLYIYIYIFVHYSCCIDVSDHIYIYIIIYIYIYTHIFIYIYININININIIYIYIDEPCVPTPNLGKPTTWLGVWEHLWKQGE